MKRLLNSAVKILSGNKLLRSDAYINGTWVKCRKSFPVTCPSTNEILSDVGDVGSDDVSLAINSASAAQQEWNALSAKERSSLMFKFYENMILSKEELAQIMSAECGKTIRETRGEVDYGASFLQWFAEEAKRTQGDVIPGSSNTNKRLVLKMPVGVAGLITPWNFPLAMITRKLGAAMGAGCASVIKPSEETPLTALALASIADEIGFPAGLINVLPSSFENTPHIGNQLCGSDVIRKISFTGSSEVGKLILEQSAKTVKRISLELGGNAPFIVFNSADISQAVKSAMLAKFRGNGQTCIAANRFLVQSEVHEQFMDALTKAVKEVVVGDPFEEATDVSSLINQAAVEKVNAHVQDAIGKGARPVLGCEKHLLGQNFYKPSIIDNCDEGMLVMREETFGPVISIMRFDSEEEGIELANNTHCGLAGYAFSRDLSQIFRVCDKVEVGMLGVNESYISSEMIPFGGVKQSGIGREGSHYGIDEYLDLKYICLGGLE